MSADIGRASEVAAPLRDTLLDAAAAQLREGGPSGLTVRVVARRAGMSPATAYKAFSSKEHLLAAVFLRHLESLPSVDPDDPRPLDERLPAFLRGFVDGLVADVGLLVALRAVFLGADPDTARIRRLVVADFDARFDAVCRDELADDARATVRYTFAGAMVTAGAGVVGFEEVPGEVLRALRSLLR